VQPPGNPQTLSSNGITLAPETLGELAEANHLLGNGPGLKAHIQQHGYLFFRGLLPRQAVLDARSEILLQYATIGEIDSINHAHMEAIGSEHSFAHLVNLRAFTESVRSGQAYTRIVTHQAVLEIMASLLDDEVKPYDFRWPRFVRPGEGCGFHYDGPYMSRGTSTERIFTSWIPLGDVPREEGALLLLEGSHLNQQLLRGYARKDADRDNIAWLGTDPNKLQSRFGGRWLSTDFKAGDVLCFGMHMLHGALDNRSPVGRCRLTSDSRYQSVNEPFDERWNGARPIAHGYDKVFFPGLGHWNNRDFQDEWKKVDEFGRLLMEP
jgi:ectoine hydroxylase-related dioxygenase (phytanoyl-CoA dioxygenase family)